MKARVRVAMDNSISNLSAKLSTSSLPRESTASYTSRQPGMIDFLSQSRISTFVSAVVYDLQDNISGRVKVGYGAGSNSPMAPAHVDAPPTQPDWLAIDRV